MMDKMKTKQKNKIYFWNTFKERIFFHNLAYMAITFNYVNGTNISVQVPEVTNMDATEKLQRSRLCCRCGRMV
jgi:hypothetical protein